MAGKGRAGVKRTTRKAMMQGYSDGGEARRKAGDKVAAPADGGRISYPGGSASACQLASRCEPSRRSRTDRGRSGRAVLD